MRPSWPLTRLLTVILFLAHVALCAHSLCAQAVPSDSQTTTGPSQYAPTYRLNVAVDEVVLTFHADDVHGLPRNDLKLGDLKILDEGKPPRTILDFRLLQNSPVRAAILVDVSDSMRHQLPADRAIAIQYAQKLLRQQTDAAYTAEFGRITKIVQPWTNDPTALTSGIRAVTLGAGDPIGGTAVYDALFDSCLYQFEKAGHAASGNFILLFSDGGDNASFVSLKDAVDMCQRSNTAIYSFLPRESAGADSAGTASLLELAQETGGRIFVDNGSEADQFNDLRTIESDVRNQYRLIYRPAALRHDGSFHHIKLEAPERFDILHVRSGYYAPTH